MTLHVTVDQVTKVYGRVHETLHILTGSRRGAEEGRHALDNVSLSFHEGDRVGFIGRNGAGKSTLLRVVAGLTRPTRGTVTVKGAISSMLTLGIGLRDDLPGYDNILIDGELRGLSRAEVMQDIDAIVAFADLGNAIHQPVRTYSSGMKARLAFAMMAFIEPEILLIDETLSVGDAAFAEKARARITELCGQGRIAMLVSHAMESIIELCNRAIWLEQGQVMMDGDPESVCQAYLDHVRSEDEKIWLARFNIDGHSGTTDGDCAITRLDAGTLAVTGENLETSFTFRTARPLSQARLHLTVERVDGTKVSGDWLDLGTVTAGDRAGWVAVRPLILRPGLYCLRLDLLDDDRPLAWKATVLEVTATGHPAGGKPLCQLACRSSLERRTT